MAEDLRMWMEIPFNVVYLAVVWGIVIAMTRHRARVAPEDQRVAGLIRWAYLSLATGDLGHVGFRLWAYGEGGLDVTVSLFGLELGLVGMGALATSITLTFFYVLMQMTWQARYQKPYGWFGVLLFAMPVLRFLLMLPAGNDWNSPVPPQDWSIARNLPLIVLGLGTAWLVLRDAAAAADRPFRAIGIAIVCSYACYLPVVFFVQQWPMLGLLMIPKTVAYIAIAAIAYRSFYARRPEAPLAGLAAG